jgi:prepilin-type N-terminal cleavage/methylation domain-containing protein
MKHIISNSTINAAKKRGGFTLIEILVAVAIMAVLLTVILVPLRLGFETTAIGKSRSDVQQQAELVLTQIGNDLRKSQFVYANSRIPGISDGSDTVSPCSSPAYPEGANNVNNDWQFRPYVISDNANDNKSTSPSTYGVCSTISNGTSGVRGWNNLSRIDMLQQRRSSNGTTLNSSVGQDFIVTYYTRRFDLTKPFDIIDNPIVLFRAQIPFRERNQGDGPGQQWISPKTGVANAEIDWTRYPARIGSCTTPLNSQFLWITHNYFGEADLQPLTDDTTSSGTTFVVPGAHTLVTPRDMSLVAPRASLGGSEAYVPELSFQEASSDGKRVDRVTVTMTLAQYDSSGAGLTNGQAAAQRVKVSRTFDLPNAGCGVK